MKPIAKGLRAAYTGQCSFKFSHFMALPSPTEPKPKTALSISLILTLYIFLCLFVFNVLTS